MCGRFANHLSWLEEWEARLGEWPSGAAIGYNIAPTAVIPVFSAAGGDAMRWGLVPAWSKEPQIKYATFNAKVETVSEKPAFRDAWRHARRCVVPVLGYYEWQRNESGAKQPFFIQDDNANPLFLGGLWERWARKDTELLSCTVLTCASQGQLASIHDRMPLLIPPDDLGDWLDPDSNPTVETLVRRSPDIQTYMVSTYVNNARHEGPVCVAPLTEPDVTRKL